MNTESGFLCYPCDNVFGDKRTCLEHINSKLCKLGCVDDHNQLNHAKILGLVCFSCEKAFKSKIDAALHLVYGNCCSRPTITSTCTGDQMKSIENNFNKLKI